MIYSEEKIPSAIERYQREITRIFGVLESVLSTRRWLVGSKCSVADLSFVTFVPIPRPYNPFRLIDLVPLQMEPSRCDAPREGL